MEIKPVNNNEQITPVENRIKCSLCERVRVPGNRYCWVHDQAARREAEKFKLISDQFSCWYYSQPRPISGRWGEYWRW